MDLQAVIAKATVQSPKPEKTESGKKSPKKSSARGDTFIKSDDPAKKKLNIYTKAEMPGNTRAVSVRNGDHVTKLKASIEVEVEKQATALLQSFSARFEIDIKIAHSSLFGDQNKHGLAGLRDYFAHHPEALTEIEQGNIPEYFSVENTGKRMLDILLAGMDETEITAAWVEDKKALVGQAYTEVSDQLGGLPEIVLQTRDYVLGGLDALLPD